MAARIAAAVQELQIEHAASRAAAFVTVSIGGVCVRPVFAPPSPDPDAELAGARDVAPASIEQVFERADAALYAAKNAGRNRCEVRDFDGS